MEAIAIANDSYILNSVLPGAVGNGGAINITARSLSVTDGTQLAASTSGQGNAGIVNLNARDIVSFDGGDAFSYVADEAVGNGGAINITAGSLSVTNGAQLQASTFGRGDAGSVNINARDIVSFDGLGSNGFSSGAFSYVADEAVGNGGGINITTGSFSVTNGAQLQASTRGQGDAGSVNILARDTVSFDGVGSDGFSSGASSTVESGAVGNGGDINITTGSLAVTNGARLSASSEGSGAAGNLEVSASSSIRLENQALFSADSTAGQGNIALRSQDLVLRRGSNITTNATGTATGGNITIDTGVITALENSDISANAQEGFGGRVIINAQGIFGTEFRDTLTPESDTTASSLLFGEAVSNGTVELNIVIADPIKQVIVLSTGRVVFSSTPLVDITGSLIAQRCAAGRRQGESKFIITGRGELPIRPTDAHLSYYPTGTVRSIPSSNPSSETPRSPVSVSEPSTNPTSSEPPPLVEAQGWVINDKGEVVLTAQATTATPHNPWMNPATCRSSTFHQQPLALGNR